LGVLANSKSKITKIEKLLPRDVDASSVTVEDGVSLDLNRGRGALIWNNSDTSVVCVTQDDIISHITALSGLNSAVEENNALVLITNDQQHITYIS